MLGTSRILEKGPEYLRKQMEREREATGRVSAAERLAATKINYVRSPQVGSPSSQSPFTGPNSASGSQVSPPSIQNSPTRSPHLSSPTVQESRSLGCQRKPNFLIPKESPVRLPAGKEVGTRPSTAGDCARSKPSPSNAVNGRVRDEQDQMSEGNIVKRNSSKKRPDSILLYRQKCELQRGSRTLNIKPLFLSSLKEKNRGGSTNQHMAC